MGIVEGKWDCPYCETKYINGRDLYCPCCKQRRQEGTKFYVSDHPVVLGKEDEQRVRDMGRDWVCPFCDTANRGNMLECTFCHASRDADATDYDGKKYNNSSKPPDKQGKSEEVHRNHSSPAEEYTPPPEKPPRNGSKRKIFVGLGIILAMILLIFGGICLFSTKPVQATVDQHYWSSTVSVEEYKSFQESGWSLPSGAELNYTASEIRTYEQVFDHYETKTREVAEQVQDGYDITYKDLGNGYFEEVKTPKYKTEYHTETYQEAVYRDEPVYDTKYYYTVWRWTYSYSSKAENYDMSPYYADVTLRDNERVQSKRTNYVLVCSCGDDKNIRVDVNETSWRKFKDSDSIVLQHGALGYSYNPDDNNGGQ